MKNLLFLDDDLANLHIGNQLLPEGLKGDFTSSDIVEGVLGIACYLGLKERNRHRLSLTRNSNRLVNYPIEHIHPENHAPLKREVTNSKSTGCPGGRQRIAVRTLPDKAHRGLGQENAPGKGIQRAILQHRGTVTNEDLKIATGSHLTITHREETDGSLHRDEIRNVERGLRERNREHLPLTLTKFQFHRISSKLNHLTHRPTRIVKFKNQFCLQVQPC